MAERVHLRIGPVAPELARAWLDNSRRIVVGVRENSRSLSIEVNDEFLDLIDVLLDLWTRHASTTDVFDWSTETDTDQVLYLVRQWIAIGTLTSEELALIGCTWAPEWTRPFSVALEAGALRALEQAGPEGERWAARLTGPA